MATGDDLRKRGFHAADVTAKKLGIEHPDPMGRGPFCRLIVEDDAPDRAGVYAWVVDDGVQYVGMSKMLPQVVHGQRLGRANNDYTYIPLSKIEQLSSPRVRVNGLLNRALVAGHTATWWWLDVDSEHDARILESRLIAAWTPPWNRARPGIPRVDSPEAGTISDPIQVPQPTPQADLPFTVIWERIRHLSGAKFTTKTGRPFSYAATSGGVSMNTTNHLLPKGHFQEAFERLPLSGPSRLQDLRGPSYLYAILIDPRVAGED